MLEEYYEEMERLGKQAEELVLQYLVGIKKYKAKKVDHEKHPFDIGAEKPDGKKFRIEVKVYGAPYLRTIFAETLQISPKKKIESTPEYLTYYENIEYMMYVDLVSKTAYVYNMPKFASYVLANKSKEFLNNRGTAMGIKIPEKSEEAGFICKLDLSSR
jgi:hypothetical protein